MPPAATISTPSHHPRRSQFDGSYSLKYQVYEDSSTSTVSDPSQGVRKLAAVGAQRRVRAGVCENPPEERHSRGKGAMNPPGPRRTYSHSRTSLKETYAKEPRVVVREVRRKSDSEHRRHHRRYERDDAKEVEKVYVYRTRRKSEEETDRSRPSVSRRSTTNAGEASRTRHERQRTDDRELPRRRSERRPSYQEDRVHTTLRHEKRSIADHVPKSARGRAPITR